MTIDEMELVGLLKDVESLPSEALDQARLVLRATMFVDGASDGLMAEQGRRQRRRTLALRSTVGVGIAASLAAGLLFSTSTVHAKGSARQPLAGSTSPSVHAPLMRLADYITANAPAPTGNATLVIRTQSYPDRSSIEGADLYTDGGEYFYSTTESGLPSQIQSDDNIGDGMFAREVAAAVYAVNGNLDTARHEMAYAPFASGTLPSQSVTPDTSVMPAAAKAALAKQQALLKSEGLKSDAPQPASGSGGFNTDNYIWMDSLDAFNAGAGDPQVRAGILRILSTLPEVTVTNTIADGQPALTITASAPALPTDYQEALTINAQTGVPISFAGGTPGQTPSVTITYQISRVTLSDIEAGRF